MKLKKKKRTAMIKKKKEKEISRVLRTWHLEQGQRPNIYIYFSF